MALLSLPWSWKPLWAPLVDRFGAAAAPGSSPASARSRRSPALMPFLPADSVGPLLIAFLLFFTVASATQDIAIDAWAVDSASGRNLGMMNGLRASAFRVAVIAAGGLALFVADRGGWTAAWIVVAFLFAALAVAAFFLRTPARAPRSAADRRSTRALVRSFLAWLLRPRDAAGGAVRPAVQARRPGDLAHDRDLLGRPRARAHRDRAGGEHHRARAHHRRRAARRRVPVAGRPLRRTLLDRPRADRLEPGLRRRRLVRPAAKRASGSPPAFENFTQGLGTAALLSFLTACCRRENAATEYALLSALFAFSREIAGAASGFGAERMGYAGFFAFTALIALPALCLLPWLSRRSSWESRRLHRPEPPSTSTELARSVRRPVRHEDRRGKEEEGLERQSLCVPTSWKTPLHQR